MANVTRALSVSAVLIIAMAALCVAFVPESDAASSNVSIEYASPTDSITIRPDSFSQVNTADTVKITTKNGSMVLSPAEITDFKNIESNVIFKVSAASSKGLSENQAKDGYKLFSVTLKNADGTDHALTGKVTVYIPYQLSFLEIADKLSVKYVDSEGYLTDMPTRYEDGYAVFETDHFSEFLIQPTYEAYTDVLLAGLGILCILVIALLAVILIYMRYTTRPKRY
jgi:formylmethanofuran dehydrogenase subunit D